MKESVEFYQSAITHPAHLAIVKSVQAVGACLTELSDILRKYPPVVPFDATEGKPDAAKQFHPDTAFPWEIIPSVLKLTPVLSSLCGIYTHFFSLNNNFIAQMKAERFLHGSVRLFSVCRW